MDRLYKPSPSTPKTTTRRAEERHPDEAQPRSPAAVAASGPARLPALKPRELLQLQRTVGNRMVQRMIDGHADSVYFEHRAFYRLLTSEQRVAFAAWIKDGESHSLAGFLEQHQIKLDCDPMMVVDIPSDDQLVNRGAQIHALGQTAEQGGANLWSLTKGSARLYLLGTVHVNVDSWPKFAKATQILNFLKTTTFHRVFAEISRPPGTPVDQTVTMVKELMDINARLAAAQERRQKMKLGQDQLLVEQKLRNTKDGIDEVWPALAAKVEAVGSLETEHVRRAIRSTYQQAGKEDAQPSLDERTTAENLVYAGNQQGLMASQSIRLGDKVDQMDIEARNQHWIRTQNVEQSYQNQTVLWVVGATHLGGLIGELKQAGWAAAAQAL